MSRKCMSSVEFCRSFIEGSWKFLGMVSLQLSYGLIQTSSDNIYERYASFLVMRTKHFHVLQQNTFAPCKCFYVASWVSNNSTEMALWKNNGSTTAPSITLALVTKHGIKGFFNESGERKVSEIFIISVIFCPSSQRPCLRFSLYFTQEKGCVC